jgi:hypothetical protein
MTDLLKNMTPRAEKVFALARKEADRLNHISINTEHILLSFLRMDEGIAGLVLKKMGAVPAEIGMEIERQCPPNQGEKFEGNISYAPRVKTVLALAAKYAKILECNYVAMEHLLLGLLAEGDGVAARVLTGTFGITLSGFMEKLEEEMGRKTPSLTPTFTLAEMSRLSEAHRREYEKTHQRLIVAHETNARLMSVISEIDKLCGGDGVPQPNPEAVIRKVEAICFLPDTMTIITEAIRHLTEALHPAAPGNVRFNELARLVKEKVHSQEEIIDDLMSRLDGKEKPAVAYHGTTAADLCGFQRWWMVLNPFPNGRKPTRRHESQGEAYAECQRVADATGQKCHVLEKVHTCLPKKPFWCKHWKWDETVLTGRGYGAWSRDEGEEICGTSDGDYKFCPFCGKPRPPELNP